MHIGVVGGGYWGSKHVRVLSSLGAVSRVTLVEQLPERRADLTTAFPNIGAVASLDDVLDELDGVVIATRTESHVPLGLAALRAGKHVLIEKPMATSIADARLLCQEADSRGLVLMAGHTFVFNPVVVELKRRIDANELGDIQYLRSLRLNLGLYQPDVNVIWDLAPHDISIIDYLLDGSPSSVTAWAHHSAGAEVEDVAILRLEYEADDIDAYVHVSWLDPSKVRELTVVGSRKMAVYDDVKTDERLRLYDRGVSPPAHSHRYAAPMSYRYGDINSPFIDFTEPLYLEDTHFVEAILTGGPTRADGRSAMRVVGVLEAAQRSLELGRPVRIAEVAEASVSAIAG